MSTTTNEMIDQLPRFTQEEFAQIMHDFITNGKTIKDIKGLSWDDMEAIYTVAYNTYNSGDYEKAHKVFQFLCYFDHLEKKYWLGLGACRQLLKQYQEAVEAFTFAGMLDADDPRPPMQAAECHIALGNTDAAISGLYAAQEWSGDRPEYQQLKQRASAMSELLQESANKQEKRGE